MTDTDIEPTEHVHTFFAEIREPTIRMSRPFGALAKALAAAECEMKHPVKGSVNPAFKSKYADLANVVDSVKKVNEHGIAVMGSTEDADNGVRVLVLFAHESDQWMEGSLVVPLAAITAQGLGSALTYGRRYLLSLMCNVASDDDDDGNEATAGGATVRRETARSSPVVENKVISGAHAATVRREAAAIGASDTVIEEAVRAATNERTDKLALVWQSEFQAVRKALEDWGKTDHAVQPTLADA